MDSIGSVDDNHVGEHYDPSVRLLDVPKQEGTCGFHLTRSKWDPYPWISGVDKDTLAAAAGLKAGDCVLEVNGEDVLGMRIAAVAALVRAHPDRVGLLLWSTGLKPQCNPEALCCGPMPSNLQRLSASMAAILSALECPVCMDTIPPPALQCGNGHLVCIRCRNRTERCPVCRERYGKGRSLLADQVYNSLTEAFELRENHEDFVPGKLRERLFGPRKPKKVQQGHKQPTPSHTNKFLARIMGKSSSVENLSSNNLEVKKPLSVSNEDLGLLKAKSLSTSEIFRPQSPIAIPRCPSANRLEWSETQTKQYGLTLNAGLNTRRPLSRHNSVESLQLRDGSDIIIHVPNIPPRDRLMNCPCDEQCVELIKESNLTAHIIKHGGPLVQWGNVAEFPIPPIAPLKKACFVLKCHEDEFYLIVDTQEDNDNLPDVLIWCWIKGSSKRAEEFLLDISLRSPCLEDDDPSSGSGKQLCARTAVYSLEDTTWKGIKSTRRGVFFSGESLAANFGSRKSIQLRVEVSRGPSAVASCN